MRTVDEGLAAGKARPSTNIWRPFAVRRALWTGAPSPAFSASYFDTFADPSRPLAYPILVACEIMKRGMPRPEDVSRSHIDATVIDFLQGERDADWTEVSLVTLHPREEIRLVLKENADRYRIVNETRFRELVGRLRSKGVALRA